MSTDSPWLRRGLLPLVLLTLLGGAFACPLPGLALEPGEFDPAPFDAMLKKYVHDGWVDYAAWKANDLGALDTFLKSVAAFDLSSMMGKEPRACFLINAYNAWAVRQILENYPVESISQIEGFFHHNQVEIAGEQHTLKTLEQKTADIISRYPTFAFALASGTIGGPKLRDTAFHSDNFMVLLNTCINAYVVQEGRIYYDAEANELHVPPELLAHVEDYFAYEKGLGEVLANYVKLEELVAINYNKPTLVVDGQDQTLNDLSRRPGKTQ